MIKHILIYTLIATFCLSTSLSAATASFAINAKKLNQALNDPVVFTQAGMIAVALENDTIIGPRLHMAAKSTKADQNLLMVKPEYEKRAKYTATLVNGQQITDSISFFGEEVENVGGQVVSFSKMALHKTNKVDVSKIRGTIYYPEFTNVQTAILQYVPDSFVKSFSVNVAGQYQYSMVDIDNQTIITLRYKNPKKKIPPGYFIGATAGSDISMSGCFSKHYPETCEIGVSKGAVNDLVLYFAQRTKVHSIPFNINVKSPVAVSANTSVDQQAIFQLLITQYKEAEQMRNSTPEQRRDFMSKNIPAEYLTEFGKLTDEDIQAFVDLYILGSTFGATSLTEFEALLKNKNKVLFTFSTPTTANVKVTLSSTSQSVSSFTLRFKKTGSTWAMVQ